MLSEQATRRTIDNVDITVNKKMALPSNDSDSMPGYLAL